MGIEAAEYFGDFSWHYEDCDDLCNAVFNSNACCIAVLKEGIMNEIETSIQAEDNAGLC